MVNPKSIFLSLLGFVFLISCGTETVTYTLDVTPSPPEGGTVSPTNEVYQEGEEIQLLATPSEGWRFVNWDGDWSTSDNPTSVIMNKNYTIKGNFTKRDYPLNIEIIGEGTVEEEIISQKTTDYPYGTVVRLTPKPNQDWVFDGWSGDISDENDVIELTIDKETNITITFIPKYKIILFPDSRPLSLTLLDTTVVIGITTRSNEGVFSDNPNVGTDSFVLMTLDSQGNILNKRYEPYFSTNPITSYDNNQFVVFGSKSVDEGQSNDRVSLYRLYNIDLSLIVEQVIDSNHIFSPYPRPLIDRTNQKILNVGNQFTSGISGDGEAVFKSYDLQGNLVDELILNGSKDDMFLDILSFNSNKVKIFGATNSIDGDFQGNNITGNQYYQGFEVDYIINQNNYSIVFESLPQDGINYKRVNESTIAKFLYYQDENSSYTGFDLYITSYDNYGNTMEEKLLFNFKNYVSIYSIDKIYDGYLLSGNISSKDGVPNPFPVSLPSSGSNSFILRLDNSGSIIDLKLFDSEYGNYIWRHKIGLNSNYYLESFKTPRIENFSKYRQDSRLIIELK